MTAATKNTNTPHRLGLSRGYGMSAATHAYAGTIAVLNGGFVEPATTATGLIAVGVFSAECDNSAGGDGDMVALVERGIYRFANSTSTDAITTGEIGKACYAVDDLTVAKTDGTGTRSIVGIVDHIDDSGVWVLVDPTSGVLV
jgi:hypothetical protein